MLIPIIKEYQNSNHCVITFAHIVLTNMESNSRCVRLLGRVFDDMEKCFWYENKRYEKKNKLQNDIVVLEKQNRPMHKSYFIKKNKWNINSTFVWEVRF